MTKKALGFLRELKFLRSDNSVVDLSRIPQTVLNARLTKYFEARKRYANKDMETFRASMPSGSALISSQSAANTVASISSKLLTQENLIVNDPLLKLAMPKHEIIKGEHIAWGSECGNLIDRDEIIKCIRYFSGLAPFIEAGVLHVLPLELLHDDLSDGVPLYAPKNLFRELVPHNLVEFVNKSAIVQPVMRHPDGGLIVMSKPNTERGRQISIRFKKDPYHGYFYTFRENLQHTVLADHVVELSLDAWDDRPLDKETYDRWLEQSVNKVVGNRIKSISDEMNLADAVGGIYLTESTFEANLLAQNGQILPTSESNAINFLRANSNLLNIEDPKLIFRLRSDHGELLRRFRLSLSGIVDDLTGLSSQDFDRKAQILFEREIQPQIFEVNDVIGRFHSSLGKGLVQTGGVLLLALLTGSVMPAAAALVFALSGIAGEALPNIGEYQRMRRRPQFIWNQLKK